MDRTEELLKELTEANGVAGYEQEIRRIMIRELEGNVDEVLRDKLGSVVGRKAGDSDRPRVLVIGHMDEIGFMVKEVDKYGFIKFLPLGGWWPHVALGQRMRVITSKGPLVGVIGSKPPHLLEAEERAKVQKIGDMILDVGAQDGFDVRKKLGVKEGDPVVPDSKFEVLGNPKLYLSKAFDNRMGCAVALEVVRRFGRLKHPNTIFAGGTAQEEVGLRGAQTLAHLVDPDVCLCVDVGVAQDLPPDPYAKREKLGSGPSVLVYDARMIPNLGLRDLVVKTAEEKKIPFHMTVMERGAGDGGPVHLSRLGVPTLYLGAPVRYIHGHNGIMSRTDFDNTVKLIVEVIKRLDKKTVKSFTEG